MNPTEKLRALARRYKLREDYPQAVLDEADAWVDAPGLDDPELLDLRHLPFVTIDDEHSRDLDQALHVEASTLWYALADASYYVPVGSAIWNEALERGATYYLPGFAIPMLPRALSEGIVSLNPDVDRRALVMRIQLDAEGRCTGTEMLRALVRSRAKLSFEGVQAFYDGAPCPCEEARDTLLALREFGEKRCALDREGDKVRYRRREVRIQVGPEERSFMAFVRPRNAVERYNEQCSLLCNAQGMEFVHDAGEHVHPIYRVHPPPDPTRIAALRKQVAHQVRTRGLDGAWVWKQAQTLGDYLEGLPREPLARAIHRQAIIANRPSEYTLNAGKHHGVGVALYGRFSAPMREVVGVWLHKELFERMNGAGPDGDAEIREQVIESGNRSRSLQKTLEREANRLVLDELFEAAGKQRFAGTLLGVQERKLHVQLDEPPVDVKIYLPDLPGTWEGNEELGSVSQDGSEVLSLGDRVEVQVLGVDSRRNRWKLGIFRM